MSAFIIDTQVKFTHSLTRKKLLLIPFITSLLHCPLMGYMKKGAWRMR